MDCRAPGARNDALPPTSLREARLCVGVFDVDLSGNGAKSIFDSLYIERQEGVKGMDCRAALAMTE
jgi:hypothetical protein